MKKVIWILIIITVLITVTFFILKQPKEINREQTTENQIIQKALVLYEQKKAEGLEFSSQCLGVVDGYAVDIVHVPRNEEDNRPENQCEDYRSGRVSNFIELDKDGNLVRIV